MDQGKPGNSGSGSPDTKPVIGHGLMAGIVAVLVIALISGFFFLANPGAPGAVPPETCAQEAMAFVNANLVQEGYSAELGSVQEANGVYRITVRYQDSEIPLYATKDCTLLLTNAYTMDSSGARTTGTPVPAVKSARPLVELYVMALCPYGVQVENVLKPVVDLLGNSADIKVRYIATVPGDTVDTVQSLHGPAEAAEDVRQICIAQYSPDKYWAYLAAFNAQCYPAWNNAEQLAACRENVTTALLIPAGTIDRCVSGTDGVALLKSDETWAMNNKATASPTLIINGQVYSGARTSEAIKQAICGHFDVPPEACDTVLSAQASTVSGSC